MMNSPTRLPRNVLPYPPSGLPACGGVSVTPVCLSVPVCVQVCKVCVYCLSVFMRLLCLCVHACVGRKKKFVIAVRDLLIMGFACSFVCNSAYVCEGHLCWYNVVPQEIESIRPIL